MSRSNKTSQKNRTNYIYYGVDGTKTVLIPGEDGVTETIIQALHSLDDEVYDINRKETRRHESLEGMGDKTETVIDSSVNLEQSFISKEEQNTNVSLVHKALTKLRPQQQEIIKALYLSDKPISQADYARQLGIEESSVSQSAWRAKNKLKEIIKDFSKKV